MGWRPGVRTGARNGRRPGRSPGCAARVIGSTSSQRKADIPAKELGYDAAVLRDAGCVEEQLRAAAPDGVDVVIDQLKAAVAVARSGVRVALIGALAGQLGDAPAIGIGPMALITRSITLRGAPLFDHLDIVPEWTGLFGRRLRDGTLSFLRTVPKVLDQAPRALRELMAGRRTGTVHVEL
ncbi:MULTISPECIES: zinc-binding dehydrogenase [Streptomyces]|uniref:Alcohol dehydrogenase-like C-terminal domain-containing protein n=1 Tax=Streptomyces rimosus subsp. rimosus (strain ATCC 10970 / DSM 40260 / JCM 4667 / NRRL 2234) TaxID=1265868 RepID=A0A8A1V440_STRR1|nr:MULTISPECIES: zinc-binding dehydrogenase [Streptomyces]MYT47847.1 hypothetical protein [Streptomyces sp. SID5471]QST85494.1 hypothetical protein SRIM_040080 [Streptomyces rimosus subsp. rimosus ATCC 10970]